MGLSQISVLAFVFDTTGSMSNYIAEAKTVTFRIIDSRRGTSEEPSEYILVPFNDQGNYILVSKKSLGTMNLLYSFLVLLRWDTGKVKDRFGGMGRYRAG